jgi:hypothetical protein
MSLRQSHRQSLNSAGNTNAPCWSLASIDHAEVTRDLNAPVRPAIDIKLCGSDVEISPQLPFGGIFKMRQLAFAGLPKPLSGEPKTYSRDRENDSETRDDFFFVLSQKMPESSEREARDSENRAIKGGAVFWIIVIGGCLLVYWAARRSP